MNYGAKTSVTCVPCDLVPPLFQKDEVVPALKRNGTRGDEGHFPRL